MNDEFNWGDRSGTEPNRAGQNSPDAERDLSGKTPPEGAPRAPESGFGYGPVPDREPFSNDNQPGTSPPGATPPGATPMGGYPPNIGGSPYGNAPQAPQNGPYQNGSPMPPAGGYGQPPVNGQQWVYNDYGPLGGPGPDKPKKDKTPKPPKPPKPQKEKNVREKEPRQPGNGFRTLAILMCILFVLSTAGFGTYVVYDLNRQPEVVLPPSASSSAPSITQQPTPDDSAPSPEDSADTASGKLTGNEIHKKVEPAVVGVIGYVDSTYGMQEASEGSGVVFTQDGYIVTNSHVITDERTDKAYDKVEVLIPSGERYTAQVVGKDKDSDLAVLKVDAQGLTAATFGDSDQVKVGDRTFVIGNPSGIQFAGSFTGGYISAVNRYVGVDSIGTKVEFIQTDAAINPGNSGGALVNEYGQVVGITSAKLVDSAYEGMGFAIPINNVKPIIDSLIEYGWVRGRVQIGIQYVAVSESTAEWGNIPRGLRVAIINDDSDVHNTRIQVGDIIYQMDGVDVYDTASIAEVLKNKKPGDKVKLSVYHIDLNDNAERFDVEVSLLEKPNSEAVQ